MEFRTAIAPLKGLSGIIDHKRPVIMIGSCFTDNIGAKLLQHGFDVAVNPCGTLYNPASIASTLLDILYRRPYTIDDIFEHQGKWHSFNHHSRFSADTPEQCLQKINSATTLAADKLAHASALIITFGTAYVFRHRATNQIVGNCHKLHPDTFSREMLASTQIHGLWKKMIRELLARNPQQKIIFTVSPIRHLADGAHGNSISKSTLLLAIDRLVADFPDNAIYFPAYEIMIDDLRDYRFYAANMVHPSEVAIEYIYSIFAESVMSTETRQKAAELLRQFKQQAHISHDKKF
ncbi:MAG: GSCFA domain-containing protein [Muribaculum sp.]|nr:GSCFA domain-containing protein [Muribaculaceae bacterium]MCM1081372.1 GSCFA domain-containing protein [Muribaculum sp.]